MRQQPETSTSPLLTLCAGAVIGIAGTYLFRAAKHKIDELPEGASAKDALNAINPMPALSASAKAAKETVEKAASAAKDKFNQAH